jgi:hypothetical protein
MIQKVKHVKAFTWIPKEEYDQIERIKGDISVSLWIKRAIRNALSVEGERLPAKTPQPAAPNTTLSTPQASSKEVEAVS